MQYRTLIVDDESHAITTLQRYIANTPDLILTGSFENPIEALEELSKPNPPHIAFLDIDMPELTGLALANLIEGRVEIIFTSAHQQYALEAYDLQASGYLLKPFSFEAFLKTVRKVCSRINPSSTNPKSQPLFFSTGTKGKLIRIMSDDILYLEAMQNYVKIYSSKNSNPRVIYSSLKEASASLRETNLIRVNRSIVVNTVFVEMVYGNTITISNGQEFQIGPKYRIAVHNYLRSNTIGGAG
jgi:DNA-binding LytR/AlgR family response regulator